MEDWREELKEAIEESANFYAIVGLVERQIQQAKIEALKKVPTGTFDSTPYVKEMISSLEEQ